MSDALETAEALLREAVFRSRAKQAAGTAIAGLRLDAEAARDARNCGLGVEAAVELDLSERGVELAARLWPDGLEPAARERVRAAMRAWIERRDALDRKRNHFLRDFRGRHGYDRTAYAPEVLAAFEDGLAAVNAEVDERRRDAARELLDAAQRRA